MNDREPFSSASFPQQTNRTKYRYDYRNRRIQRQAFEYTGSGWPATPTTETRWLYEGDLAVQELDGLDENAVQRSYTWGLDLAGQRNGHSREGAGGIGGLLGLYDATVGGGTAYVYAYDAHGNVGQVVKLAQATWSLDNVLAARYEYDPYGILTVLGGTGYQYTNAWRFSTKWQDDATGLVDFGRRWYWADLGRWVNRDPIEETGGANLYAYASNTPTNRYDALGLVAVAGAYACPAQGQQATQPATQPTTTLPKPCQDAIDKALGSQWNKDMMALLAGLGCTPSFACDGPACTGPEPYSEGTTITVCKHKELSRNENLQCDRRANDA